MNIQTASSAETAEKAGLELGETGLSLTLPQAGHQYFNYYWLRDNCPSSFDPVTRERSFDIFHLEHAPKAASATLLADHLEITWADEDHVSRFPLDWLEIYATGRPRPDPADVPRRAWYCDHYSKMARFSFEALSTDKTQMAQWIEALIVDGVSIVEDMPNSDQGLTDLAHMIGQVRPTFYGPYFDVYLHIDPINAAYTARALELHTDVPAEEFAPGVQFLHCRANSVNGGQSLFVDGTAVANEFRKLDPEGFKLLSEIDIPFYWEHDGFDVRARQRVIELDSHGAVSGLTISQHLLDMIDLPQSQLDSYYPAFCRFGKLLQDPRFVTRFTLKAGECIVFDNHRVVHGREAYVATSGERYLRGTYVDRAEMRSKYRALVSEGRFTK